MPQMMPINWLMSFIFFLLVFILFNIMNYYIFNMKMNMKKNNKNISLKNFSWKW